MKWHERLFKKNTILLALGLVAGSWLLVLPKTGLVPVVEAVESQVLGVHILNPSEIKEARDLLSSTDSDQWFYLTIPVSLDDLDRKHEWQQFFDEARRSRVIPLVRLATRFDGQSWKIPNKKEIVDLLSFLGGLNWPTSQKYLIVFNEVNHSKEWGGRVDPASYLEVLKFTSYWARSEGKNFMILPAAMDLAAPTSLTTREAFLYLQEMYRYDPEVFTYIDFWNSHSYPNPGFSSSPQRVAKNSLWGFIFELDFLKQKTGQDYRVFITETGWILNRYTSRWLTSYYTYALQHVWSHPQVVAVTPFTLRGSPGPFEGFSFLDADGQPTRQYEALQQALIDVQIDS